MNIPKQISLSCKEKIVYAVDRFKHVIGFKKVLKLFKITSHTFYLWKNQTKYKCVDSWLHRCFRTHPRQLSQQEVSTMKSLYCSFEFKGWSIYSIALYCKITGILSVSLNSWYKYLKLLNLHRHRKRHQYQNNKIGIRADRLNQIWHADVMVFKTLNNQKAYIYFIVDNFSRYILSYAFHQIFPGIS